MAALSKSNAESSGRDSSFPFRLRRMRHLNRDSWTSYDGDTTRRLSSSKESRPDMIYPHNICVFSLMQKYNVTRISYFFDVIYERNI